MESRYYLDLLTLKAEMQFRNYSNSTQTTYYNTVKDFLEVTDKEIIDVTREDIIKYLDNNLELVSINTVLVKLNALEFFFEEILGLEITYNIRKYKRKFKVKEFLSQEQLNNFIESVPARERLFYKIIIETGWQAEKTINVEVEHLINKPDGFYLKDKKISKDLAREIANYIDKRYIEKYIFYLGDTYIDGSAARYWLRINTKAIFGETYTFNDIRHSVALEMIKKGNEEGAMEYLGVKSTGSIRQYYKRAGYDYTEE